MIASRVYAFLRRPVVGVVLTYLVGIALRVNYTIHVHPPETFVQSDMYLYVTLARNLLEAPPGGPWDVMLPLGFPTFLAFMMSGGGSLVRAGYAQMVVGCLVPGAVGLLGAAAFGRRAGLLALVFASFYFPFIEYGALFLTEIHFTLWLALAFAAFFGAIGARRRAVSLGLAAAGGVALSIAVSMKNVGLVAALVFFAAEGVALLLARRAAEPSSSLPPSPLPPSPPQSPSPSSFWRPALQRWLLRGALVALGAAPLFAVMTKVCTDANRGHFCFSGNKPAADFLLGHYGRIVRLDWERDAGHDAGFGSPGSVLRNYQATARVGWVITDNAANAAQAWRWIAANPSDAVVLSLDHIYDTFLGSSMWPSFNHDSWPYAHLSQYVFVIALFIPTLSACRRAARGGARAFLTSRTALVLSPLLALTFTVAIATGEVRYRIPFDVFFIVTACALFTGELRNADYGARARTNTPTTGR